MVEALGPPARRWPDARGRALAGLRVLLARVARWRRLVLWIDRAAALDMESALAFDTLLSGRPLDVVVVLTARPNPASAPLATLDRVLRQRHGGHTRWCSLGLPCAGARPRAC